MLILPSSKSHYPSREALEWRRNVSVYKGRPTCSKISTEDRFTRNLSENT